MPDLNVASQFQEEPNEFRNPVWIVFCALAGFLLFIPDLDTSAVARFAENDVFNGFGVIDPDRFIRIYGLIVCACIAALCFFKVKDIFRNKVLIATVSLTGIAAIWGAFMCGIYGKYGFAYAFRGPAAIAFYLFAGVFVLFSSPTMNMNYFKAAFCGVAGAALTKLCVNAITTLQGGGGAAIFQGVRSVQTDGPTLLCQCFVGCICILAAFSCWRQRRIRMTVIHFAIGLLMFIGLALSFRRLVVIEGVCVLFGAIVLDGWLHGVAAKSILVSGVVLITVSTLMLFAAAFQFGSDVIIERFRSVTFEGLQGSGNSAYDASNQDYIDHWERFPGIVSRSRGLGMGYDTDYDGLGPADPASGEEIPLHVGSFELLASVGIAGVVFWAFVLVLVPIYVLRRAKFLNLQNSELLSAAAMWVLFTAFCPLGPPFYIMPQQAILVGGALGFMMNRVTVESNGIALPGKMTNGGNAASEKAAPVAAVE